jgi:hypothetical protein
MKNNQAGIRQYNILYYMVKAKVGKEIVLNNFKLIPNRDN